MKERIEVTINNNKNIIKIPLYETLVLIYETNCYSI